MHELLSLLAEWITPSKRTVIDSSGCCELVELQANHKCHKVRIEGLPSGSLVLKLEDAKKGVFTFWNDTNDSVCPFRKMCDAIILFSHSGSFFVTYVELKSGDCSRVARQFKSSRAAWSYLSRCMELEGVKMDRPKERFVLCTCRRLDKKTRSSRSDIKVDGVSVTETNSKVINLLSCLR